MQHRNNIFISYSHQDRAWLDRLHTFLKPLVHSTPVNLWDDTKIDPGSNWQKEIEDVLDVSQIAILLVSANFLSSDFILNQELPKILKKSSEDGLVILWVSIGFCMYEETELAIYRSVNNPAKPLDSLTTNEQDSILLDICKKIKNTIKRQENILEIDDKIKKETELFKLDTIIVKRYQNWSLSDRMKFIDLLLNCPTLKTESGREILIQELPLNIQTRIQRGPNSRIDVKNILDMYSNFEKDMSLFIQILEQLEGNSNPFKEINTFLNKL